MFTDNFFKKVENKTNVNKDTIIGLANNDKRDIADVMLDRVNKKTFEEKVNYKNDIIVAGTDNILVNLAKCCNPVPGDEIIGYITKGEGVSVHKKDCPNLKGITTRLIDVEWNNESDKLFITSIYVKTNSQNNHLLDLVTCASTRNISINSITEKEIGNVINYQISVKIPNTNELSLFIEDVRNLDFVSEVIR